MKYIFITALALILSINSSYAFPPAPHHTFQGLLRDEHGRPITWENNSKIIFESNNGSKICLLYTSDAADDLTPTILRV